MIYRVIIPIPNYEGTGIYDQHYYFSADACPTRADVVRYIQQMDDCDSQYQEYTGEHSKALKTISDCTAFPFLKENQIGVSFHTSVGELGLGGIGMSLIRICSMNGKTNQ
jgi:hypothetical protein